MDSELDRRNLWDEQSCAEFEAWLDEVNDERFAQERDSAEPLPAPATTRM